MLEQVRVCEGVLAEERKQHASAREDLTRLNQELEMIREDLFKEKTAHREDTSVSNKDSPLPSKTERKSTSLSFPLLVLIPSGKGY